MCGHTCMLSTVRLLQVRRPLQPCACMAVVIINQQLRACVSVCASTAYRVMSVCWDMYFMCVYHADRGEHTTVALRAALPRRCVSWSVLLLLFLGLTGSNKVVHFY